MKQFLKTLGGLLPFAVSLHWVVGYERVQMAGGFIVRTLRAPLMPYYRKKAIRQLQRARETNRPPMPQQNWNYGRLLGGCKG